MNKMDDARQESSKTTRVPWWIGFTAGLVFWEGMPWAVSRLGPRYGWAAGGPGLWNLLGLILVIAGTAGLLWTMSLHAAQSAQGIEWVLVKSYLLRGGPYAFSRHPMYLSELTIVLGWAIFHGSLAVLAAFLAAWAVFNFYALPTEERAMEDRFGETYVEYKKKVPRWLGFHSPGS